MTFPAELKAQFITKLKNEGIAYHVGWSNYMGTVRNPASLVVEVDTKEQLSTVIKKLAKLNADRSLKDKITLRAAAGWRDKMEASCCFFPWQAAQESQYNESYSFSQVVGGRGEASQHGADIILRFSKKFHQIKVLGPIQPPNFINPNNPIHQLPSYAVRVSAGVQIAQLAEFLRKKNLSLTTVSMISWVSAVGLAGTAGHGTGRDEPSFSGLIESMVVCDMDGQFRELHRGDPDFADLVGGHSGLLGVVVSMTIRTVQAFNLEETIALYPNAKAMKGCLSELLSRNQYVSIMGIPTYSSQDSALGVNQWQISQWNYSMAEPTQHDGAPYAPNSTSFIQELEVNVGASIMEHLLDSELKHLMPYFMQLTAATVTGSRGTKSKVDFENHITHPQVGFPKLLHDVSYLIPVKDHEAGQTLETILQGLEGLLKEAGKRGEYPVTYAIYVRYIKGTNGGLSTSFTAAEDERILAIDVVTHTHAPGILRFEQQVLAFFQENNLYPRNHLGKNFPKGVVRYEQFLGKDKVDHFHNVLERWYCQPNENNGAERLAKSPFYSPYMQKMLTPTKVPDFKLHHIVNSQEVIRKKHTNEECSTFLKFMMTVAGSIPVFDKSGELAKTAFLTACEKELQARSPLQNSASIL